MVWYDELFGLDLWRQSTYYQMKQRVHKKTLVFNHHSPERLLIELKIEHADLNALVDATSHGPAVDELLLRRLKKRRLQLRDRISNLETSLITPEPA